MVKKKDKKKEPFFIGLFDLVDLAINFLPGKALTALLLVGVVSGTVAYSAGIESVEISVPDCPEQITCPEAPPCPVCEDCKDLDEYTDEELIDALKPRWICYQND